jgi:hypothetical protein
MTEEAQATCGFILSACAAWVSHALAWTPVLQFIAVVVAILSGCFAVAISAVKLYDRFVKGHRV